MFQYVCKQTFHISRVRISQKVNLRLLFLCEDKVSRDFHICISLPLNLVNIAREIGRLSLSQIGPPANVGSVHSISSKFSTSWKCSLHTVYVLRQAWKFWIKFETPDQSFNKSILTTLYVKFETFEYAQNAIATY